MIFLNQVCFMHLQKRWILVKKNFEIFHHKNFHNKLMFEIATILNPRFQKDHTMKVKVIMLKRFKIQEKATRLRLHLPKWKDTDKWIHLPIQSSFKQNIWDRIFKCQSRINNTSKTFKILIKFIKFRQSILINKMTLLKNLK